MGFRTSLASIAAVVAFLVSPIVSYGAAQLRAGALTSAQPTSANPQLRQIQITFDPDIYDASAVNNNATYNVTSFQLSVLFDPTKVSIASSSDLQLVSPFQSPFVSSFATPGDAPSPLYNTSGVEHFISGSTSVAKSSPGDVNIFSIIFTLNAGTTLNDLLSFTIYGDDLLDSEASPDFITGTDPLTGLTKTTFGSAITPTTITNSFNGFAQQIAAAAASPASTPLPMGVWSGIILLAGLIALSKLQNRISLAR